MKKKNDKGKDGPTVACRNVNWKFGKKQHFFEQDYFRKPLGQDDVFARSHKNLLRIYFFQIDLDLQYLSCWLPLIIIFSHTQNPFPQKSWDGVAVWLAQDNFDTALEFDVILSDPQHLGRV